MASPTRSPRTAAPSRARASASPSRSTLSGPSSARWRPASLTPGVTVAGVSAGGPAQSGGLRDGDPRWWPRAVQITLGTQPAQGSAGYPPSADGPPEHLDDEEGEL